MKKNIKEFFLFAVIIISLIFACPSSTYALSKQTSYISIDTVQNLEVENLSFSNISFKDYTSTSTQAFGLTGIINNSSKKIINYISTVYYYDSNYNLVTQESNSRNAVTGISDFNQMSNLSILGEYDIRQIYYYRLSINILDNTNSLGSNNQSNLIPSEIYQSTIYDYVIDRYNIDIIVNENNTFDITETITAYFNIPKHGISRIIPLKNTIKRLDGTTSTNRAQISNISVDNTYKISRKNGNYKLQIGSAEHTLTGEQTYVIKYTYNIGKDPEKNYDELYYNIIGDKWDTVIGNITFTIIMPKDFDSSKLGFSSGNYGSTDNNKINYNVIGNKIIGNYNGILGSGQALTIRCELPEGYFVGAHFKLNIMDFVMFIIEHSIFLIPIIFLAISILLWYKFGRDDKIIETVEFYPPEGLNSLDIAYIYKDGINTTDIISLLIFLANKGYLEIVNDNNDFFIRKLKDYDGMNLTEQLFMQSLFENNTTEITSKKFYYKVYIFELDYYKIAKKNIRDKIFEKSASNKKIFIIMMIIATYFFIMIHPYNIGELGFVLYGFVFPLFIFTTALMICNDSILAKIFGSIIALTIIVSIWYLLKFPAIMQDISYLIYSIVGSICIICMVECLIYLPKRTKHGNEMLGRIKGFRNFLEIVEKERLELLVIENPNYFYDILPYTYVLGVSDKWINEFKLMPLQEPSWYDSYNTFDVSSLEKFMDSTINSTNKFISSLGSSSSGSSSSGGGGSFSGGGSSGGGFSGGGSGGGGGSSW